MKNLNDINKIKEAKVVIVGDIMLDKYISGFTTRISPEAPVQVVDAKEEELVPGGAANVARNVLALDGQVKLIGISGKDSAGNTLIKTLAKEKIKAKIFMSKDRQTTQKNRIVSQNQQLLRVDYEDKSPLNSLETTELKKIINKEISKNDYVIVSDYAKGTITQEIYDYILSKTKNVIVDPKPRPEIFYHDAFLITPNLKEARTMTAPASENNYENIAEKVKQITNGNVLLTLGDQGMLLYFDSHREKIKTEAKQVFDVTGAGDTVAAIVSAALSVGLDLAFAAKIANTGAGIVVGKPGTATVSLSELKASLEERYDNKKSSRVDKDCL